MTQLKGARKIQCKLSRALEDWKKIFLNRTSWMVWLPHRNTKYFLKEMLKVAAPTLIFQYLKISAGNLLVNHLIC
jgi:hypothetical protein